MDQTATELIREIMSDNPEFLDRIAMEGIQVKTIHLRNITSIRDLNANTIDNLVAVRGIVMRCSDIIPEM